ncbi:hypothetical protein VE00_07635 [Pseudogymnoascus sp. WSF 3629]|nr:hypothetical protein VE00_07635 [Pseudogymnoascus sp. WSF 3629]
MSSDALPIGTAAFAAALEALPLSTLHLKAAELRNSLAHLEYSNAQLEPYARPPTGQEPDIVCVEAIAENSIVMERMRERLALLRQEAEKRGVGWGEFVGEDEIDLLGGENAESGAGRTAATGHSPEELTARESEDLRTLQGLLARRESGSTERLSDDSTRAHSAWTDGTFQTGRITNGVLAMDDDNDITSVQGAIQSAGNNTTGTATNGTNGANEADGAGGANTARGGTLSDEELRRRLEERLTTEDDGSLYL